MINNCFLHLSNIGPKTIKKLYSLQYTTWESCLENPKDLPFKGEKRNKFLDELKVSYEHLQSEDISFFVNSFPQREHWRILWNFFNDAVFFDIETTDIFWQYGFTSVICALAKKNIYTYVYEENLDSFLDLIEESKLIVSFNGNSFDVPFLEKSFNIPFLNCPHIDIRWIAYHCGFKGGLKSIEQQLRIKRKNEIRDIDGEEAIRLFYEWQDGDLIAKNRLIEYCTTDVIATYVVAGKMIELKSNNDFYEKYISLDITSSFLEIC